MDRNVVHVTGARDPLRGFRNLNHINCSATLNENPIWHLCISLGAINIFCNLPLLFVCSYE